MKLRWPTRYERTRGLLLVGFFAFPNLDHPSPMAAATAHVVAAMCIIAFLIVGLLKPLHDSTGEDA